MITHEDRVLHYALRRALGGIEPVDLAPGIVEAWERGERGTYVPAAGDAGLRLDGPHGDAGAPRRRPWRAAAAVLAAASIAAVALTFAVRSGEVATPVALPYAVASRPVQILGPDPVTRDTRGELRMGDRVLVTPGERVEIALASGGRLRADPGTILSVDERDGEVDVRLDLGTLQVHRGTGPAMTVATRSARLVPDSWALLTVRSEPDAEPWVEQDASVAIEAVVRGEDVPRVLLVEVDAGTVALASWDTTAPDEPRESRTLFEHDALWIAGQRDTSIAASDAEWLLEKCMQATPVEEWAKMRFGPSPIAGVDLAEDDTRVATAELRRYLGDHPERWALLHAGLGKLLDEEPEWYAARLLSVVVRDPSEGALRLARALWRERPELFGQDHVVELASRGAFEFEREVVAVVDAYEWGDELVPVQAAAHLASLGDERGVALLEDAVQAVPVDELGRWNALVAALGLDALGRPQPWRTVRSEMAREALYQLERGGEVSARAVAATLGYVEARRASGASVPVAFLDVRVAEHALADGASSTDELRRRLEGWIRD